MKPSSSKLILILFIILIIIFGFKFWQRLNFSKNLDKNRDLLIGLIGINLDKKLDLETINIMEEIEIDENLHRQKIVFMSDDTTIPCFLFYPKNHDNLPAILVIPGHGDGILGTSGLEQDYQNSSALEIAKAGFVTLTCENRGVGTLTYLKRDNQLYTLSEYYQRFDHDNFIYNGFEVIETVQLPEFFNKKNYLNIVLEDQKQAVDYLASLSFVDSNKIGAAGISLGGELAMYLAVLDERIKSVVVVGWLTDWSQLANDIPDWKIEGLEENFTSMADIAILAFPKYQLFHNGLQDASFPTDKAELIFSDIKNQYENNYHKNRVEFWATDVDHEFVNDLAVDFFERSLK
jgi:dienelactone hydrolase